MLQELDLMQACFKTTRLASSCCTVRSGRTEGEVGVVLYPDRARVIPLRDVNNACLGRDLQTTVGTLANAKF